MRWASWVLLGWSARSGGFLPEEEAEGNDFSAGAHLAEFRRQWGLFDTLCMKADENGGVLKTMVDRSTFKLPVVQQLMAVVGRDGP